MKVEVEKHVGHTYHNLLGFVETVIDQLRVFATGVDGNRVFIGYLSNDRTLPFMPTHPQPKAVFDELYKQLDDLVGWKVIRHDQEMLELQYKDNEAGDDELEEDEDENDS